MKNNINDLLKAALTPMDVPGNKLNEQLLGQIKERKSMTGKKSYNRKRIPMAVLVAACVLILGSITAVAAYRYLNPAQVAAELKDESLEKAFQSEGALLVNETQESGGYRITLLGSVAGKNISEYLEQDGAGELKADRIYSVVAIEHVDGTPMPETSSEEYGKEAFYVSHYIQGLDPEKYSLMSMGGGYSEFVKDGVAYRVLEMDNIEMFADRRIYVGVSSGIFYDQNAYIYDESTGEICRNENYNGVNALFILPLDANKADPDAAAAYLENFENPQDEQEELLERTPEDVSADEFMEKLTSENLKEYARPIESTTQTCVPDKDGAFDYSYKVDGVEGEGTAWTDVLFPDGETGVCRIDGCDYCGNGLKGLYIHIFTLNEDGTVTYTVYSPIVE